ncbi:unnamed protein product [Anisakis simplex]|uniref:C2H2-type domain-containing protein n=1 Tax=Anisakis simplex TaxID=6269 RepID=A0A0M3K3W7_ANISI|nr:unnamed protein product [Anisakis simplex]
MESRPGVKRARAEEDPRLDPFEGLLRARGVEGIPCANMLQVLTVLQIIPATCRFEDYCWAAWHVMARHAGPINRTQIAQMKLTGVIPEKLIDAFCRVNSVLLIIHPLNSGAPVKVYGRAGEKIVEAAEHQGTYAAFDMPTAAAAPAESAPKTKTNPLPTITEEEEDLPGPSSRPDFPLPNIVLTSPGNHNYNINDDDSLQLIDSPAASTSSPSSPPTSPNSPTNSPTGCRYNFRHPRREATPLTLRINPEFEAANITSLTTRHAAELANTIPAPYRVTNNKVSHCTWCGHTVIVPEGLSARQLTIHMEAHRAERCVAAPKRTMAARMDVAERLQELGRDSSHIALPGATSATEGAERKRRRTI